jgi:RNA polymerase sigma-70 factor (sigma-E family)
MPPVCRATLTTRRPGVYTLSKMRRSTERTANGVYCVQTPIRGVDVTFEEFAAARLPALMRFAVVLTGDRGVAEDVVQEVLIRLNERWRRIAAAGSPEPYVRRMVVNQYLSWRRRWWRHVPHADPGSAAGAAGLPVVPDPAGNHADRDALLAELRRLPPRQRAVLVLRYYEGLPDADIAQALGCTPGTVRSHASRGLAALRIELTPLPAPARKDH